MIKTVYYSYLNPESLITLAYESLKIIKTNHPKDMVFAKSTTRLADAIKEAELAVGKTSKENLTDEVYQADANRDTTFIGFKNHIAAGLRRHRNPVYQKACEKINNIIEKYGSNVYKLPYPEQSTAFNSLLNEFNTQEIKPYLEASNSVEWINELALDQQDFDTIFLKRNTEKAADNSITDKEALKVLKPELNNFYTLINAFYINGKTELETTINEINSTIDRIMNSAKRSN